MCELYTTFFIRDSSSLVTIKTKTKKNLTKIANQPAILFFFSFFANHFESNRTKGNGPCLGEREAPGRGPYKWKTYTEVLERIKHVGSGIINSGIDSNNETHIGIYSSNRSEVDLAGS
jgi:hypothetical protein